MAIAVLMIVVLGIVALVTWLRIRHRHQRDLMLSQQWAWMLSLQQAMPDAGLAQVSTVYQPARHGSKAVIVWLSTGYRQDTWFEGNWPHAGSIVLLRGSTGWGPHNRNPHVFYVNPDQLLALSPPGTMAAAQRQYQRETKRSGR